MPSMDGVRCRMHYKERGRSEAGVPEGELGTIVLTHRGKRLVKLDSGRRIVCPMWNAVPVRE